MKFMPKFFCQDIEYFVLYFVWTFSNCFLSVHKYSYNFIPFQRDIKIKFPTHWTRMINDNTNLNWQMRVNFIFLYSSLFSFFAQHYTKVLGKQENSLTYKYIPELMHKLISGSFKLYLFPCQACIPLSSGLQWKDGSGGGKGEVGSGVDNKEKSPFGMASVKKEEIYSWGEWVLFPLALLISLLFVVVVVCFESSHSVVCKFVDRNTFCKHYLPWIGIEKENYVWVWTCVCVCVC